MRMHKGFRIPEKSDQAIRWPDGNIAIWRDKGGFWLVTGVSNSFITAEQMVTSFGNDWQRIVITSIEDGE